MIVLAKATSFTAYVTKLPEAETRQCLDQLIPPMGGSTRSGSERSYEVHMPSGAATLTWHNGIAIIRELGSHPPPTGIPSRQLLGLAMHVPLDAAGFLLSSGYPDQQIKSNMLWFRFSSDAFELAGRVEGSAPGAAQKWLHGFVEGIKEAAAEKGITVDKSWFTETLDEPVASIEARVPLEVLGR